MIDPAQIAAALATIPALGDRAADPRIDGDRVSLILDVSGLDPQARDTLEAAVRQALALIPGVAEVRIALTAQKTGRRLVAIASGKGGVGKSTVATNLAIALHRLGLKVGIVDADIYGPSQPRLTNSEGQRPESRDKKLVPVETAFGIPLLSMGHLVKPGQAIAWRGPMTGSAIRQLIDANWGDTELLIVDLPPGTGDVQMSMISQHKPVGAVIVSTPQDLALIDAARAIDLFDQSGVPIIGVIENMTGYACPGCGTVSDPFGSGGAEAAAHARGHAFLGRIPLDIAIRTASDAGQPPASASDDTVFTPIASQIQAWLATAA